MQFGAPFRIDAEGINRGWLILANSWTDYFKGEGEGLNGIVLPLHSIPNSLYPRKSPFAKGMAELLDRSSGTPKTPLPLMDTIRHTDIAYRIR